MDHMMPKMNGTEATKTLRDIGYTKPVVALTANAVAGSSEMFLQSGFDGYISKPIDLRELNAILNRFIRDRQPPERSVTT
jgi:CheY-like chemotaxis protein